MIIPLAFAALHFTLSNAQFFHHKCRHASIVAWDRLWIDGGDLTTWDRKGNGYSNGSTLIQANDTSIYSISLTQSWSTDEAPLSEHIKDYTMAFDSGTLWSDASGQVFHQYDGGVSLAQQPYPVVQPNQLWTYSITGMSYKLASSASTNNNFTSLNRVQEATYASGNGLGFALGGFQALGTTPSVPLGQVHVGGIIMYNTSSQQWYNVSAGGDYASYTSNGAGHLASIYGPEGLFMAFGGLTANKTVLSLEYISIFEPVSQQWGRQRTSGDLPPPVHNPCVVGTPGNNGSYQIFLYGGLQSANKDGLQAADPSVYVLSLPAFRWFRVATDSIYGRSEHSCNVARGSQMIVVGGKVARGGIKQISFDGPEDQGRPDPSSTGIQIFDMSLLRWSQDYNSNSVDYRTPQLVQTYMNTSGNATFDDPAVASWFAITRDPAASKASASPSASDNAGHISTAALAGAVVGGVIGVLALAGLVFWLLRRRRKNASMEPKSEIKVHDGSTHPLVIDGHKVPVEVGEYYRSRNSNSSQVYELEHPRHELLAETDYDPTMQTHPRHELLAPTDYPPTTQTRLSR